MDVRQWTISFWRSSSLKTQSSDVTLILLVIFLLSSRQQKSLEAKRCSKLPLVLAQLLQTYHKLVRVISNVSEWVLNFPSEQAQAFEVFLWKTSPSFLGPKLGVVVDSSFPFSHWTWHPNHQHIPLALTSKYTQNLLFSCGLLQEHPRSLPVSVLAIHPFTLKMACWDFLNEVLIMSLKAPVFWPLLHLWPQLLPLLPSLNLYTHPLTFLKYHAYLHLGVCAFITLPKILPPPTFARSTSIFLQVFDKCYLFGEAFLTTLLTW